MWLIKSLWNNLIGRLHWVLIPAPDSAPGPDCGCCSISWILRQSASSLYGCVTLQTLGLGGIRYLGKGGVTVKLFPYLPYSMGHTDGTDMCTAAQCCIVLYCIILYCVVPQCTVLYCIVLYCTVLYSILMCCIVLYCIVLYFMKMYFLQ